ncbi:hypothetical protein EYB33_12110 [Lysinibacillus sphaericus]|uniref:PH domain-containing protein n=1 Tax=Lysinibacillus TaxID=400634 RepID=UPI00084B3674|nr:PH domain-containing protein [Lysinibacillus sphaericus]OEC01284.1 hypothetical protein GY31_13365 [Lysinibacillus sphaericus]UDK97004.1 hypothetical protein EYB33_12110 [Lysinibacillus sphaericus]
MFKRLASSAFGLSNIGVFVADEDLENTLANNYILDHLEEIFYLIQTKTNEYCFTNRALIHMDGTHTENKRNVLNRYDYSSYVFDRISLETGTMDIDAEMVITLKPTAEFTAKEHKKHPPLKETLGKSEILFTIVIHKDNLDALKALYKTLVTIGQIQKRNISNLEAAEKTLNMAFNSFAAGINNDCSVSFAFKEVTNFADQWLLEKKQSYANEDFLEIFQENKTPNNRY